jgi:acid phosphatase (class A)
MTLRIKALIFITANILFFSAVDAGVPFISKIKLDYKQIMGDYPKLASAESLKDFAELYYWQKFRTQDQCDQAQKEVPVNLTSFFGGPDGPLQDSEIKKLKTFFYKYVIRGGGHSTVAKFLFRRPRPYQTRKDLVPCIDKSKSYAYPSGHTTVARVLGLMLSHKFPDREKEFMERADQIAKNRIIGGVHHPSDIVAGKKLADKIVDDLMSDEMIMHELDLL